MSSNDTSPTVAIVIQARLGSSRLPGKVTAPLVEGKTVLEYLLDRVSTCREAHQVVVATTTNPGDDPLAAWLADRGQPYLRGSETDCLERFRSACVLASADVTVRITSDCPLVVPEVVDSMIAYYVRNRNHLDYLSNRQYTDFPEGVDVEIFSREMLEEAAACATEQREREHINYYFLDRPERFRIRYFNHGSGDDYSRFKLSIDTLSDLEQIRSFFTSGRLPAEFTLHDLLSLLRRIDKDNP